MIRPQARAPMARGQASGAKNLNDKMGQQMPPQ